MRAKCSFSFYFYGHTTWFTRIINDQCLFLQLVDVYRLVESDVDIPSVAVEVVRGKLHLTF